MVTVKDLPLSTVNGHKEPRSPKIQPSSSEASNFTNRICPTSSLPTPSLSERSNGGAAVPPGPLDNYLSLEGKARQQGTLRSMAGQFAGVPGLISLAGGFPPPHLFPYADITLRLHDGTTIDINQPADMTRAQQYNFALKGHPSLVSWVTDHMAALHAPPAGQEVLITNGGNHALEMIATIFLDRGDSLLVEEYSYPVMTESIAQPKGLIPIGVPIDSDGIIPSELENVLKNAALVAEHGGRPMPKLLYTVPTGQNPTGCTTTVDRRRQVYQLCRQYDIWIIEDDAYYYLQYDASKLEEMPGLHGLTKGNNDNNAQQQSYLSMDVDGRVMRVDTFAKFLAPGLRLGWVTARQDVINKLTSTIHSHTVGPCSLSQAVTSATLHAWGPSGLHHHLQRAQREYAQRLLLTLQTAEEELQGLAEWSVPKAGMFLWLRVLVVEDASEVWEALKAAKVVVLPGRVMHWKAEDAELKSPYLRLSYSNCTEEELQEGVRRVAAVLRQYKEECSLRMVGHLASNGQANGVH